MIRGLLSTRTYASSIAKGDVFKKYSFVQASKNDTDKIVDFLSHRFIKFEPHSKSLKLTPNDMKPIVQYIAHRSLCHPFSYLIYHKDTSELVGCRMFSIGYRDESKDVKPFELNVEELNKNVLVLIDTLEKAKSHFWKHVDPSIEKVIRREITFVENAHQRQGIAKALAHHGFDIETLKAQNFGGFVSEASSIANQTLLEKQGYQCLYESDLRLKMDDGTDCIKVYFKDIRK